MPPQDKAELFRLAFMAGTKQAQLEAPEPPDNSAFPFHAAAAATAQPCSRERQGTPESGGEGRDRQTGGIFKASRAGWSAQVLMEVNATLL